MSDSTATQAKVSPRLPAVTRREASALRDAVNALRAIEERGNDRGRTGASDEVSLGTRLSVSADYARDALTSFLISTMVYAEDAQAERAFNTSWPRS